MAYESAFSYSGKYVRQLEMRTDLMRLVVA